MLPIDAVSIQNMSQTDIIAASHSMTAVPAIGMLFIFFNLILLLVGLSIAGTSSRKFNIIFITVFVLSLAFSLLLIFIPDISIWVYQLFH